VTNPLTPRLLSGGLILLNPESGTLQRVITLQYNPDTLTRGFQIRGAGGESGARSEVLRLTGPPVQTITFEAELDAIDQLQFPADGSEVQRAGLTADLAALEQLAYPSVAAVQGAAALLAAGSIEIAPASAPSVLFSFGRNRVLPVRITELSITEEAFDAQLDPIRAKVRLGLRVLTVNEVGLSSRAGALAMAAHRQLEANAGRSRQGRLADLGIERLP
jgi:hypothetical protein